MKLTWTFGRHERTVFGLLLSVDWTLTAVSGSNTASTSGTQRLHSPEPGKMLVALRKVTDANLEQWVRDAIGERGLKKIIASLQTDLERAASTAKTPVVVIGTASERGGKL